MLVSNSINVNGLGHLTLGGCDCVSLAKNFGTPLIAYSEDGIRANCRAFVSSIKENYEGKGMVLYASKAFSCMEMCRICKEEGMGLDVVSGGEIYTALKAGFPAEKLYFHGNNKTRQELEYAVDSGVGRIVADNVTELDMLNDICVGKGKKAAVLLRIKPGIDAHTHDFIRTGQIDSKFGFALETGEAIAAVEYCLETKNIELKGLHCHIGSQIFDIDPFELAAQVMMEFIALIRDKTGVELSELDLGGGFGIKYKDSDKPEVYSAYMKRVSKAIHACAEKYKVNVPFILIEPGRSIVGAEGLTLYTVGAVKKIPGIRNYVSIDGGMGDNPRYILYQAQYEVLCAGRADEPRDFVATIAGKCCESGDLIQEFTNIQRVLPGDTLAVLSTGAYCYAMASNYNRIGRPAVVMVKDGEPRLVIKRESYEDMIKNDV